MDIFWEKSKWELDDRHLAKISKMPFKRDFPFIPKEHGLYIIRGPRQVGKSSWLKTILSEYVKNGKKCFYLSCEEIDNYKSLIEVLRSLKGHDLILLDEVSFVEDWTRAVKFSIDSGWTKVIVVTGSHAFDLKLGADRMPGRFDAGGEFTLLPMDFNEFCATRKSAGWSNKNRLDELKAFFRIGGFPTAVAEAGKQNQLPQKTIDTYWRWLVGDIMKLGKSEEKLTELLIQLATTMQNPISFTTLAKKTNIGSHNTVAEYISVLESSFALRTLFAIDLDSGSYRFKKDRKFYFTDPMMYWLAISLSGRKPPDDVDAKISEMVANEALARRYKRFGYHSNRNGEVDFLSPSQWAIELKWSQIANDLSKTYLNLIIPEKIVWTQNNFISEWPSLNT